MSYLFKLIEHPEWAYDIHHPIKKGKLPAGLLTHQTNIVLEYERATGEKLIDRGERVIWSLCKNPSKGSRAGFVMTIGDPLALFNGSDHEFYFDTKLNYLGTIEI